MSSSISYEIIIVIAPRMCMQVRMICALMYFYSIQILQSFKTKNHYIVAMTPLTGTVLDFLTLIYQENCSCIVSMEPLETLNDKVRH